MKQKGNTYLVFPKKRPKTILGLYKWHRRLLKDCLYFEFNQRTIKAGLIKLNKEIEEYVRGKEDGFENQAKLALGQLNILKQEWTNELETVKAILKIIHDTNEMIIYNLVKTHEGEKIVKHFDPKNAPNYTNLLHGKGWMFEVQCADLLENMGYVGFVTFGTLFDPAGFDVIAFPKPLRRIKFKMPYLGKNRG